MIFECHLITILSSELTRTLSIVLLTFLLLWWNYENNSLTLKSSQALWFTDIYKPEGRDDAGVSQNKKIYNFVMLSSRYMANFVRKRFVGSINRFSRSFILPAQVFDYHFSEHWKNDPARDIHLHYLPRLSPTYHYLWNGVGELIGSLAPTVFFILVLERFGS